ncbi:MAG: glycerol-3-phosphate acyltransferase [Candidatus Limivicinus sp.]|jgi:glycerol-3-phosphate acyltransferase PlsY
MIVYWFLLLITSIFAYGLGSMSTVVIASNYVFRASLHSLGRGNVGLSNFKRIYGAWGFIRLLIVELLKDILPVLLGGLLLGIRHHADIGFVFAGFCVVLGRLYPLFYNFRGSHASICLIVTAFFADPSVGAAVAVMVLLVTFSSRYVSMGAVAGAFALAVVSVLLVDDALMRNLLLITALLVFVKHIPAISRVVNHREIKLSFREDISYKLDEKF